MIHLELFCYTIYHILTSQNSALREMAYKTLVRPMVEYSSTVWSTYTNQNIDQLEMSQRRAVRNDFSTYASVAEMIQSLYEQRRSDSQLCLLYKIIFGPASVCCEPIRYPREFTSTLLQSNSNYCELLQILILPLVIVQWNRLPSHIALLSTFDFFKKTVCAVSHPMP